jgi:hypothetical protein
MKQVALLFAEFLSETTLTFNGLHGIISQEIELLLTTAVRTSKPAVPTVFASYV